MFDGFDDQLRLIFTCSHPALSQDSQVALTLREVCGLTTEAIAHSFLIPAPTVAQRIVRAKVKIRDARITMRFPRLPCCPAALTRCAITCIYLVFNEGYSASSGVTQVRADLVSEAIRLGRLLMEVCPESETLGLVALMEITDSRRAAGGDGRRRDPRAAGRSGPVVVEPRADMDRRSWHGGAGVVGAGVGGSGVRAVHDSSGHCGSACRSPKRRGHGLDADRRALRFIGTHRSVSSRRAQPRCCSRDV